MMAHGTAATTPMAHSSSNNSNFVDGFIDFIAGSLGGISVVYVGQPLDTVKVKMQTFPDMYTNMFDCIRRTTTSEGFFRGLYAGTLPAIAANVAENSVLFAGYGVCQKLILQVSGAKSCEELDTLSNATAGGLAAFFSSFTLCPTELIKCKLQAMREIHIGQIASGKTVKAIGPFELTRQILRTEGIPGLFRGLNSTIMREMPGYFFFFGGYEGAREVLADPNQSKNDIGLFKTMLAGAIGGVIFWTIIFPADVVKSRQQVQDSRRGMIEEMVLITRKEGFVALYNGLAPSLLRTIPATAALFVTYEYSKKFMHYVIS